MGLLHRRNQLRSLGLGAAACTGTVGGADAEDGRQPEEMSIFYGRCIIFADSGRITFLLLLLLAPEAPPEPQSFFEAQIFRAFSGSWTGSEADALWVFCEGAHDNGLWWGRAGRGRGILDEMTPFVGSWIRRASPPLTGGVRKERICKIYRH